MEIILCSGGNSGINICSNVYLSDLEYADDAPLSDDPSKFQVFLDRLSGCVDV